MTGLAVRAFGLDRSLWLDEFSTWWCVDTAVSNVSARVASFHGQTPLYYLMTKASVASIGENEVALRLPSLLATALTACSAGLTAGLIGGRRAAFAAAGFCWLAFDQVQTGVNARPYALAILGVSVATLGFVGVTVTGRQAWRLALVLGATLAFWSHFVLVIALGGLAVSFAVVPALRRRYRPDQAAVDAGIVALLCAPAAPFVVAATTRVHHVQWLPSAQHGEILALLAPLALPVALAVSGRAGRGAEPAVVALATAIGSVLATIEALWLFGVNLVTPRYVGSMIPLAAVIAGVALAALGRRERLLALVAFAVITTASFVRTYAATGTFSGLGVEDWRTAVRTARAELGANGLDLVLYRSGFVEEDLPAPGAAHPATRAALEGPGEPPFEADVISLTHRWSSAARRKYFADVVRPRLDAARGLVIVAQQANDVDGNYTANLLDWIRAELGPDVTVYKPAELRGIDVVVVIRSFGSGHR